MNKKNLLGWLASLLIISAVAYGDSQVENNPQIKEEGTITISIPTHPSADTTNAFSIPGINQNTAPRQSSASKKITFNKVILTPKQQEFLAQRAREKPPTLLPTLLMDISNTEIPLPTRASIDMRNVSVLDQGEHGTCTTFAVTAALNVMGHYGDNYISQLCFLELTDFMHQENPKKYPSGWHGMYPNTALQLIQSYGIISNEYMKQHGCANTYSYPLSKKSIGTLFPLEEYQQHSELPFKFRTKAIDIFYSSPTARTEILTQVKRALSQHHLVILGFMLDTKHDTDGSYGSIHPFCPYPFTVCRASAGLDEGWIVTQDIRNDLQNKATSLGGHAIIITGYDDNAILFDMDNNKHQGVLTLRNSWGSDTGDHGNYYMSYEYFNLLGEDVFEIIPN